VLDADADAFDRVMQDLCLAFNRPHTPELTRVYWESLKGALLPDVKRAAFNARNSLKKFPTAKDLLPERRYVSKPREPEPAMSTWAVAANKILFELAYRDKRRGFVTLGPELLERCLAAMREYVRMAVQAEAEGERWDTQEFNALCCEGFEKILGTPGRAAA